MAIQTFRLVVRGNDKIKAHDAILLQTDWEAGELPLKNENFMLDFDSFGADQLIGLEIGARYKFHQNWKYYLWAFSTHRRNFIEQFRCAKLPDFKNSVSFTRADK